MTFSQPWWKQMGRVIFAHSTTLFLFLVDERNRDSFICSLGLSTGMSGLFIYLKEMELQKKGSLLWKVLICVKSSQWDKYNAVTERRVGIRSRCCSCLWECKLSLEKEMALNRSAGVPVWYFLVYRSSNVCLVRFFNGIFKNGSHFQLWLLYHRKCNFQVLLELWKQLFI